MSNPYYANVRYVKGNGHRLPDEVKVLCRVCSCDYNTLRVDVVRLLPVLVEK